MAYNRKNSKNQSRESKQQDIYAEVNEKILGLMKEDKLPWRSGWKKDNSKDAKSPYSKKIQFINDLPYNPSTKTVYKGINHVLLKYMNKDVLETGDPRFLTFNNIKDLGYKLTKGSKAVSVYFAQKVEKKIGTLTDTTGDKKDVKDFFYLLKKYPVFHASKIEGIPPYHEVREKELAELNKELEALKKTKPELFEKNAIVENIIKNGQAVVKEVPNKTPSYQPLSDTITMPPKVQWESQDSFYGVLLHELSHWTGAKERLDRPIMNFFGSKEYAFEELVAELTSCYTSPQVGIEPHYEQNAAYLKGWISLLEDDPKAFFKAASKAQQSTEYLTNLAYGKELGKDAERGQQNATFHAENIDFIEAVSKNGFTVIAEVREPSSQERKFAFLDKDHKELFNSFKAKNYTKGSYDEQRIFTYFKEAIAQAYFSENFDQVSSQNIKKAFDEKRLIDPLIGTKYNTTLEVSGNGKDDILYIKHGFKGSGKYKVLGKIGNITIGYDDDTSPHDPSYSKIYSIVYADLDKNRLFYEMNVPNLKNKTELEKFALTTEGSYAQSLMGFSRALAKDDVKFIPEEKHSLDNLKTSGIKQEYGGGVMITAEITTNGVIEQRAAKLSQADLIKYHDIDEKQKLGLAEKYLVNNFDPVMDIHLRMPMRIPEMNTDKNFGLKETPISSVYLTYNSEKNLFNTDHDGQYEIFKTDNDLAFATSTKRDGLFVIDQFNNRVWNSQKILSNENITQIAKDYNNEKIIAKNAIGSVLYEKKNFEIIINQKNDKNLSPYILHNKETREITEIKRGTSQELRSIVDRKLSMKTSRDKKTELKM